MYIFESKRLSLLLLKKKKLVCFRNQIKINSFIIGTKIIHSRGIFLKFTNIYNFMLGLRLGEYISSRRLYNRNQIKKLKR